LKKWWNTTNKALRWDYILAQPWIQDMKECPQDALWHEEGDVWTHTLMVVSALHALPEYAQLDEYTACILSLTAIFHDIAKPICTEIDEAGRITSPRHAKVGEQIARRLLWEVDFDTRETICALIRFHGLPIWAMEKPNPNAAVAASSLRLNNQLLYLFAKADINGRICQDQDELLERIEFFAELCQENECFTQPKQFYNAHSQFHYFFKQDEYPSEIFDDTNFDIVILSGLPGTGKDTYTQKLKLPIVSMDDIRQELKISPTDRKAQGTIQQLAYERAKEYCRRAQSFIWNSTNLTKELRSKLINTLSVYKPRFKIVYIEASWADILSARRENIPIDALEKMQKMLEMPTPDEAHEVIYIRR
jgi:predicted kinase